MRLLLKVLFLILFLSCSLQAKSLCLNAFSNSVLAEKSIIIDNKPLLQKNELIELVALLDSVQKVSFTTKNYKTKKGPARVFENIRELKNYYKVVDKRKLSLSNFFDHYFKLTVHNGRFKLTYVKSNTGLEKHADLEVSINPTKELSYRILNRILQMDFEKVIELIQQNKQIYFNIFHIRYFLKPGEAYAPLFWHRDGRQPQGLIVINRPDGLKGAQFQYKTEDKAVFRRTRAFNKIVLFDGNQGVHRVTAPYLPLSKDHDKSKLYYRDIIGFTLNGN